MNPEKITLEALDRVGNGGEPFSAREFATEVGCGSDVGAAMLEELAEQGVVRSKEIPPGTRVWWRPGNFEQEDTQLQSLIDEVQEYAIFMLDPDGYIATWNRGAEKIKGYTADEVIGEHFSKFYTEGDEEAGVPEHHLEIAVERGRTEYEGYRVRKDGSWFWANVVITSLWNDDGSLRGFTKVTRDMTERREAKQRLQEERDLIEQALETVPVGISVISSDGTFLRTNSWITDRLGIDESELKQYTATSWDLYDEDGESIPPEDDPFIRVIETGESVVDFHCQFRPESDDPRWLSINVSPIEDTGDEVGRVVYAIDDITEQKERTEQLRRERNQTERLLETSPVAISVQDADGTIRLANRRAQDLLGLSEHEMIAERENADEWSLFDVTGDPLPPEESPAARVHVTGKPMHDEEIAIEKPNGERLWLSVSAAPVYGPDGELERIISAGEDITELKQRERELERRRSELETELSEILGRVSDAFFALDDEWQFTHVNDRAEEILSESADEVLGKRFWDVLTDTGDTLLWEEFHAAMETQTPTTFELNYERLDVWIEINAYPSETGLSVYFHDISKRKERERRLEQFASIVSHDLRNPLSIAQMYLTEAELNGREIDFEEVKRAHDRMERIIHNLLRMAQNTEATIEPSSVSLSSVIDRAWHHVKTFDATLHIDEAMPVVLADEDQLQTVFENLFRNAVEHGGPETEVRVGTLSDGFFVEDDGPGIPFHERSKVFDYGHTVNDGTGYGLTIVSECVDTHGWEIDIVGSTSGGARFEIRGVTEGSSPAGRY